MITTKKAISIQHPGEADATLLEMFGYSVARIQHQDLIECCMSGNTHQTMQHVIKEPALVHFNGGEDVHPYFYGQTKIPPLLPTRDWIELKLYEYCRRVNIPMSGICRGSQLLAVGNGCTLYEHINNHGGHPHEVTLQNGDIFMVNSYHHQAVKPNKHITVTATSSDGHVEAWKANRTCGVQWHPEWMLDSPHATAIDYFNTLIKEVTHP